MDHCVQPIKDDDSIVSERCYKPAYKNDSRKWIVRDGTPKQAVRASEFKTSFRYPRADSPVTGRRSKLLREKLLREAEVELMNQSNEPPTVEEYITTYDRTHCPQIPGFVLPDKERKHTELYEKHPLYASPGMSYWHFSQQRSYGIKGNVGGVTKIVDINNPFKRNSLFTTPMHLRFGTEEY